MGETKTQRKVRLKEPTQHKVSDLSRPLTGRVVLTAKHVQQALVKAGMEYPEVSNNEAGALSGHFDSLRLGQISKSQGSDQELLTVCDRLTRKLDEALKIITEHDQSPEKAYSGHYGGAFRQISERLADWINPEAIEFDTLLNSTAINLSKRELRLYKKDPSALIRASANNLLWFRSVVWRCRNILDEHAVPFGPKTPLRNVLVANLLTYWCWKCTQRGHPAEKHNKFNRAAAATFIRSITRAWARKASALRRDGAWDAPEYLRELKALRSPDIIDLESLISDLRRSGNRSEEMLHVLRERANRLYAVV